MSNEKHPDIMKVFPNMLSAQSHLSATVWRQNHWEGDHRLVWESPNCVIPTPGGLASEGLAVGNTSMLEKLLDSHLCRLYCRIWLSSTICIRKPGSSLLRDSEYNAVPPYKYPGQKNLGTPYYNPACASGILECSTDEDSRTEHAGCENSFSYAYNITSERTPLNII